MPTTNNPIIFDGENHRLMTADELANWQSAVAEANAQEAASIAKAATRAAALAKLGLTEAEIIAVFG